MVRRMMSLCVMVSLVFGGGALGQIPVSADGSGIDNLRLLRLAREQPVEVEAYVYRRVVAKGPSLSQAVSAQVRARLRQRSLEVGDRWYPRMPASKHIPNGYTGLVAALKGGLSGIEIYLSTVESDSDLPAEAVKGLLVRLPKSTESPSTCAEGYLSNPQILFDYFARNYGRLYKTTAERRDAMSSLFPLSTPFEIAAFATMLERLAIEDAANSVLIAPGIQRVRQALEHVAPMPCGTPVLLEEFALSRAVFELAKMSAPGVDLLGAYRGFVERSSAAAIYTGSDGRPDSEEVMARRQMILLFDRGIANAGTTAVQPIDYDKLVADEARRSVRPGLRPIPIPQALLDAQAKLRPSGDSARRSPNSRSDEALVGAYMAEWLRWEPSDSTGFRATDVKMRAVLPLANAFGTPAGHSAYLDLITYLDRQPSKTQFPSLWVAYITSLLPRNYTETVSAGGPDAERLKLVRSLNDPALSLVATVN